MSTQNMSPEEFKQKIEAEDRWFRTHWIWDELGTTPEAFFDEIDRQIRDGNIDPVVWNQRLAETRAEIEARVAGKVEAVTVRKNFGSFANRL